MRMFPADAGLILDITPWAFDAIGTLGELHDFDACRGVHVAEL